jgi:predicted DNA-binding transcriptional regulator YafY
MTSPSRYARLQWLEAELIADRCPNFRKLAGKFQISERNARRDFDRIQDQLRFPIEYDKESGGWRLLEKVRSVPGLWLSQEEWLALLISEKLLTEQSGPVADEVHKLISRYRDEMSDFGDTEALTRRLSCQIRRIEKLNRDVFMLCLSALCRQHPVRIVYQSPFDSEISERVISPQHLLNQDGNWMMISWCHSREQLRSFKPSRIKKIEICRSDRFHPVALADIEKHIDASFGAFKGRARDTAVLLFSEAKTPWAMEQIWHKRERKILRNDARLELQLPIADEREILMEALSFGADVEILGPPSLRAKAIEQIEKMKKIYG